MRPAITIGGIEIGAGQNRTVDIPITDLSTHTPINMPVRVIHGRKDGPVLLVCAAIHGDEINGVEIIRRLMRLSAVRRVRGTLIAVPIVNVFGFLSNSRYLPDRRDLNRSFPGRASGSLAARLAGLFMQEIVSKSTHGIDLHTAAAHRDNYPQIRGNLDDPELEKMARAFGVPVLINAEFREGSLRSAAADIGVPVLVYEGGEALRFDEVVIRSGVNGVVRCMRAIGMLRPSKSRKKAIKSAIVRSSMWVRAPQSGVLRAVIPLGRPVESGTLLGLITDPFGRNELEVKASSSGVLIGRTNLPLVHEGDALFHIGRLEGTKVQALSLDPSELTADYEAGITSEIAEEPSIA
ncbi:MAG: succinylglutamate desuccinylase/aspartoacylase family protein [Alphaproteobacteria bacterium]|nr:succinylglutamate desuccinylase/aspartoacylase family protein [Alphaproteobacteria bacterium]